MFKDHFSKQAKDYAKYRPTYPPALFDFLLEHVQGRETAWDCGTGNGQAALALAPFFETVIATDPSSNQIAHAESCKKVVYRVCPAEEADLPDGCADLITVAQALHWFDFDRFYGEVRRVAKPGALLAVWGYGICKVNDGVDPVFEDFYYRVIGPYWPVERRYVDEAYRTIPFPFQELPSREFHIEEYWDLADFLGYLGTWSACQAYRRQRGEDPLAWLAPRLEKVWGAPEEKRSIRWPIFLRMGIL